ncbi:MAG: stage 0 sporulation protein [Dehalococcoidia bacterium]|nr:stage 0 sporulation protein [Dehalococcoidia bacterium]
MAKIIRVRFQDRGNLFYCDAGDIPLQVNDHVMVDTSQGLDLAKVIVLEAEFQADNQSKPLMIVIRCANPGDLEQARQKREKEALAKCKELVPELHLNLKPILAGYNPDFSRLTIFFKAQERVDFRSLVRDLSGTLKTHVELRQVGPRDEAKLVGGIGICGYPLCCQGWLTKPIPISVKMAKQQDLALNPTKISGRCGRLLCCLAYENEQYAAMKEKMPRVNHEVATPFGKGKVIHINTLKETVTVEVDDTTRELTLDQLSEKRG